MSYKINKNVSSYRFVKYLNNVHSLLGTIDPMGRHDNPGHNNPTSNPHGNPHNNSNSGPVTLYDLKHGTKNAPGGAEHSVRCLLNVENWTAWRLKVKFNEGSLYV